MVDYTSDEYHRRRHPELLASPELRRAWSAFARRAYFADVRPGEAVLEFGGGLGSNLLSLADDGAVWMVEPSPLARRTAEEDGIRTAESLETLDAALCFDRILCRHVLEHIADPLRTLRDLAARLRPAGILVVVLPVEKPNARIRPDDPDHHLYGWNPQTLANLLDVAGLRARRWQFVYYGARRRLLPVYRRLGAGAYARCVALAGRAFGFREMMLAASRHGSESP